MNDLILFQEKKERKKEKIKIIPPSEQIKASKAWIIDPANPIPKVWFQGLRDPTASAN